MYWFTKKAFFAGLTVLSSVNPLNAASLNATPFKFLSITNQECKVRQQIVNNWACI